MLGKALFPAITFRNVTVQVHFGAAPLRPLPFKCHTWQEVQKTHSEVRTSPVPKDGKYQVLLPVGLPDEATFDWVDQFLSKNKNYTEISDRSILDWANKSGLQRSGGYVKRSSHDHPEMNFGLPLMDDYSVSKVLKAFATVLPRNFIIAEVKNNLLADERQKTLARFPSHCYTKEVRVLVGEPAADYKTFIQEVMLKEKKEKAEAEMKRKKAEAVAKQAEEERRKKRLEEQKQRAEAAKDGNGAEGGEEEPKDEKEEGKEEEQQEEKEEAKEEEKAEEAKDEPMEEVQVALTEEEKKFWFRRKDVPDLTSKDMSSSYEKFTLPTAEEGCDKVTFLWYKEAQCKEYLQKWVLERKMTQRVEDLQPSEWFRQKHNEWNRMLGSWKRAHQDFKDPNRRRAMEMAKKRREQAKAREEEKKVDEKPDEKTDDKPDEKNDETAEENGGQAEEGEEVEKEKPEESNEKAEEPDQPEEMKIDAASLDPFAIEDVTDLGNGEPLFAEFTFEDWMLLTLRFELHLLCHAFRHDLDDPDRPSFKENHFSFYYQKYYKRGFNLKSFGVESTEGLVNLVKDTVEMTSSSSLEPQLSHDTPLDNFVRLTEDARRDRQLRIDSGDELALLKFQRPNTASASQGDQQAFCMNGCFGLCMSSLFAPAFLQLKAPAAYDKGKGLPTSMHLMTLSVETPQRYAQVDASSILRRSFVSQKLYEPKDVLEFGNALSYRVMPYAQAAQAPRPRKGAAASMGSGTSSVEVARTVEGAAAEEAAMLAETREYSSDREALRQIAQELCEPFTGEGYHDLDPYRSLAQELVNIGRMTEAEDPRGNLLGSMNFPAWVDLLGDDAGGMSLIYDSLLRGWAQVGNIDQALRWLTQSLLKTHAKVIRNNDKQPAQDASIALIQALGRRGDLSTAESLLDDLSYCMPWPFPALVNAALRGCAESADVKGARHWMQLMSDHGSKPDGSSYLAALEGFAKCGRSDLAQSWWDQMKSEGFLPICEHYTAMMKALDREDFRGAESWFVRMEDAGVAPEAMSYAAVIERATSEGVALSWFDKMLTDGWAPDLDACKSMLVAIGRTAPARAIEWLRKMEIVFNLFPDLACYNIVLNAAVRSRADIHPEKLLMEMHERYLRPDAVSFNTVISSCARTGDDEGMQRWLAQMSEEGLSPDLATFNSVIDSFARRGLFADAEQWLQRLKDAGLRPNVRSYGPLTTALAQRGDTVAAAHWLRNMIEDSATALISDDN
ncbi:unnamed protein product [Symbiodinium natans]|uniref:Pentatricopeptide repeat-containing protein, chloroplastic n=1 Tax=Symbiodinium natans TaxID=878477 RepID=A0A812P771_9DINO|nr:unnamed protein product [Symbiodinium natans]